MSEAPSETSTAVVPLGTYQDVEIYVRPGDGYINATAMCQAVGKLWGSYWQTQEAREFADELSLTIGIPIVRLIESREGRYGGTWVHEDVALDLAGWCSKKFKVWVVHRIKE